MSAPLTTRQICDLRGRAQRLEAVLKLGKLGITDGFLKSVNEALDQHELIKIKFADLKDQKRELAPQLATLTTSTLVTLIGNVAVLYRQQADPEKRKVDLD
ncbi:MAG TPA: hypothetical protein DCM86_05450 [Verrucomicrobiales bacterium]|nr:hypothetical protein [Verrucomicrobiales bacterium]